MKMIKTPDEIKQIVLHKLHLIAPEIDLDEVDPKTSLQEEMDIDSMDFLRFLQELNAELNVEIPEKDYEKLLTIENCVDYLNCKINGK